jgi:hypothetical protein
MIGVMWIANRPFDEGFSINSSSMAINHQPEPIIMFSIILGVQAAKHPHTIMVACREMCPVLVSA